MIDWNVVVTVFDERGFRLAKRLLAEFAPVYTTDFFNVLVMKVPDVAAFTEQVHRLFEETPGYLNDNSRVVPRLGPSFSPQRLDIDDKGALLIEAGPAPPEGDDAS